MKSHLTVLAVCTVLLGSAFLCQAKPGPGAPAAAGREEGFAPEPFPAGLARILDLSETQKGAIQIILDEEKAKGLSRRKKAPELRQQLRLAERAATFNEQAVKTSAYALAAIEAEGVVSRAKTRFRIDAVLTQAQRSLAEKILADREERRGPRCAGDHEGGPQGGPEGDHEWR